VRLVHIARWLQVVGVIAVLGAATLAIEIASSGRTRPPEEKRAEAVRSYEAASSGVGARWAPGQTGMAGDSLRAALVEYSRQQNRLFVLRDFRPVAESFDRARAEAIAAGKAGSERLDWVKAKAEAIVAEVLELEGHALALVAATTLPHPQRSQLARARLLLREAEALAREGDFVSAATRARRSEDELLRAVGPAVLAAERYRAQEQVATWRRWIEEARTASRKGLVILVLKEKNLLLLLSRGEPVKRYDAEVGANALGVKRSQGDRATPEGRYRIVKKKDVGQSIYHRALLLDYPNAEDRKRFAAAKKRGEIPRASAIGGLIEIHGDGGRGQNWTDGCVALRNSDMDELFARVPVGTRVTIVGGDGKDGAFSSLLARLKEPGEGS
jgi:lipoprotein-anchoring transpeptidase ErfK/SrfK